MGAGADPLLLRHGDDLTSLGGEGLVLTGPGHSRRVVIGDRRSYAAEPGPWCPEDDQRVVHALTG